MPAWVQSLKGKQLKLGVGVISDFMNNLKKVREKNKPTCTCLQKTLVCPDVNLMLEKFKLKEQIDNLSLFITKN